MKQCNRVEERNVNKVTARGSGQSIHSELTRGELGYFKFQLGRTCVWPNTNEKCLIKVLRDFGGARTFFDGNCFQRVVQDVKGKENDATPIVQRPDTIVELRKLRYNVTRARSTSAECQLKLGRGHIYPNTMTAINITELSLFPFVMTFGCCGPSRIMLTLLYM
jgi:hypothetical protein